MELELFSWDDLLDIDCDMAIFGRCCLNVQIGEYPPGTEIACISINTENGQLTLEDDNGNELGKYKLHYRLGDRCE